jgi:hypothetical protein
MLFFSQLERLVGSWRGVWRDATRVRHVTMSIAACTAFLTFYSFAGAPTLRLVPWVHQLFSMLAVAAAAFFLVRRLLHTA